jgi:hypothetical protein
MNMYNSFRMQTGLYCVGKMNSSFRGYNNITKSHIQWQQRVCDAFQLSDPVVSLQTSHR